MARTSLPAVLLVGAALLLPGDARGGDDDGPPNDPKAPLPARVNQAIDSGVEWLKKQQFQGGNWDPEVKGTRLYDPNAKGDVFCHPTGCTVLSLYTLLKCGVPADDPVIRKGFDWLETKSAANTRGGGNLKANRLPDCTYCLSVLVLALEARANPFKREKQRERDAKFRLKRGEKLHLGVKLPPKERKWMADALEQIRKRISPGGGWRYAHATGNGYHYGVRGNADMSATQLAMLAFLAGERCGIEQKDDFYLGVLKWTLDQQEEDGPEVKRWDPSLKSDDEEKYGGVAIKDRARGWSYIKASTDADESNVYGSMTACGLANVLICSRILEARGSKAYDAALQARAEKSWHDGIAWFQEWWTMNRNPNHGRYHYYHLYCVERVGDLKGINLIAGHPWYNEGAQLLVDEQLLGGKWDKKDTHSPQDVLNTCFALLFLNRSTPAITAD